MKDLNDAIKKLHELHSVTKIIQQKFDNLFGHLNDCELFALVIRDERSPTIQIGYAFGFHNAVIVDSLIWVGFSRIENTKQNPVASVQFKHDDMELFMEFRMAPMVIYLSCPAHKFRQYMAAVRDITERKLLELNIQNHEANHRRQHS